MGINEQINKIKENWLLIVLLVVLVAAMSGLGNVFSIAGMTQSLSSSRMMLDSAGGYAPVAEEAYYGKSYYGSDNFAPEVDERVIIKTSYLSSEVKNGQFKDAESKLKSIVSSSDSFLLNENVDKSDTGWKSYYTGYYSIKVPTDKYSAVISQLKEIGEVQSFSESSSDVTGRYTDLNTQLDAEKERLHRYNDMYAEATDIEDKIRLSDLISSQERTVKYLEDAVKNIDQRVEYSQVSVTLSEKRSEYADITIAKLSQLVRSLVGSFNALLNLIFMVVPWAVAFLIIKAAVKLFSRKKR